MNKIHRIVWSDARQTWIVTAETTGSKGKPASPRRRLQAAVSAALMVGPTFAMAVPAVDALPTGGNVTSGTASISQSGSTLNINQSTTKAIINWNSFNIGSDATVNFNQPGTSAVTLNRVLSSDPSSIYGRLNATGQVFLINPNGVLFGAGSRVDVGGLVASTLNIRDEDFLAGNYRFNLEGATGSLLNQGELFGDYIALLAPEVRNEGAIVAQMGTVALAAGEAVSLNIAGDQLIDVQVDRASINTLIENRHLIQAEAGTVILSAQSAYQLLGRVVNSGEIEATGISTDGGKVRLFASSHIDHSGSINVDAGTHGNGGEAILLASLANPNSRTEVSGSITARGGSESGDGGFVETSGSHLKFSDSVSVDTSSANGATGHWLLDPFDFTVANAGGDIAATTLGTLLDNNNVTIQTLAEPATCDDGTNNCGTVNSGGVGDIIINDPVTWTSNNTLTLDAWNDILINASLTFEGPGFGFNASSVEISYGADGAGQAVINTGVAWSLSNGNIFDKSNGYAVTTPDEVDTSAAPYVIGTVAPVTPPPVTPPGNTQNTLAKAVDEAQSQQKMTWKEAEKKIIDQMAKKKEANTEKELRQTALNGIYDDETYQKYLTVQELKNNGWTAKDFKDNNIDITLLMVPTKGPTLSDGNTKTPESNSNKYDDVTNKKESTATVDLGWAFKVTELKEAGYSDEEIESLRDVKLEIKSSSDSTSVTAGKKHPFAAVLKKII